ncbi:MAG: SDR family NAD(P)-dependent oxidoreductase [Acidobacteriota bacterium]|nr:SDR family NAD(P)-dependent oxidoreductase [Acidobacteriota bacterium]
MPGGQKSRFAGRGDGRSAVLFTSDQLFIPQLLEEAGNLDVLIHCAGVFHTGRMEQASIEDLDSQNSANVRAPYLLTRRLLPLLTAAHGQIVFINSSAGLRAKQAELGEYAATKHALKAIADSLHEELNPKGVHALMLQPPAEVTDISMRPTRKPY